MEIVQNNNDFYCTVVLLAGMDEKQELLQDFRHLLHTTTKIGFVAWKNFLPSHVRARAPLQACRVPKYLCRAPLNLAPVLRSGPPLIIKFFPK